MLRSHNQTANLDCDRGQVGAASRAALEACAATVRLGSPDLRRRTYRKKSRSGAILAAALASLAVVAMIAFALTEAVLVQQRQTRAAEAQQQSFWLAESAALRAIHALNKSADYRGETWNLPAELLADRRPGVAVISVEPTNEPVKGVRVRVEARFPDDPLRRIVHIRELFVPLPSQGASP